jgi:hypothetical protein
MTEQKTPFGLYNTLKWDLQGKNLDKKYKEATLDYFKKIVHLPTNIFPQRAKHECYATVLAVGNNIEDAYKIFKELYEKRQNDLYLIYMLTKLSLHNEDNMFFTYNNKLLTFKDEVTCLINEKNFNTLALGDHYRARELAHIINQKIIEKCNYSIEYLHEDIEEPLLTYVKGPVYTKNAAIFRDNKVIIMGTNKDEVYIGQKLEDDKSHAIEITGQKNFFYAPIAHANYYHTLIETMPIYNFVGNRIKDLTFYKLDKNEFKPLDTKAGYVQHSFSTLLVDTLYLHKEGFLTLVLPRTKIPAMFDNFRPPDDMLQEYRKGLRDGFVIAEKEKRPIVYCRRAGTRQLLDDEYMIAELQKKYPLIVHTGFEADQPPLFLNARMIFGSHGAGFGNMIYAPPDCRVYEIGLTTPDNFFDSLAKTFDLKYYKDSLIKVKFSGNIYLTKEQSDLIIFNIERLLA